MITKIYSIQSLKYDPGSGIAYGASHGYKFEYDANIKMIVKHSTAGGAEHSVHEYADVEKDQVVKEVAIYLLAILNTLELL